MAGNYTQSTGNRTMSRGEKAFYRTTVATLGAVALGVTGFVVAKTGLNDPAGPAFNQEQSIHNTEVNVGDQSQPQSYTTPDGKSVATFELPPTTEVTDPLPPPEQYAPGEQPVIEH